MQLLAASTQPSYWWTVPLLTLHVQEVIGGPWTEGKVRYACETAVKAELMVKRVVKRTPLYRPTMPPLVGHPYSPAVMVAEADQHDVVAVTSQAFLHGYFGLPSNGEYVARRTGGSPLTRHHLLATALSLAGPAVDSADEQAKEVGRAIAEALPELMKKHGGMPHMLVLEIGRTDLLMYFNREVARRGLGNLTSEDKTAFLRGTLMRAYSKAAGDVAELGERELAEELNGIVLALKNATREELVGFAHDPVPPEIAEAVLHEVAARVAPAGSSSPLKQ